MAEDVLEEGEVVEEQEGQMAERMGDGWGMAEAEGGLNSRSATCYLAVAITGSNVKLVARFQTHRNIGSVHAWETVVWKRRRKSS